MFYRHLRPLSLLASPWGTLTLILLGLLWAGPLGALLGALLGSVTEVVETFALEWAGAEAFKRQLAFAGPPDLRLTRRLAALAHQAHLPCPELLANDDLSCQVATLGLRRRRSALSIDGGARRALVVGADGLLAHELGHLAHRDVALEVFSRVALGLVWRLLLLGLALSLLGSLLGLGLLLALAALPSYLSRLALFALLRFQERRADAFAVRLLGPQALITGLAELEAYEQAAIRLQQLLESTNGLAQRADGWNEQLLALEEEACRLWLGPAPTRRLLEEMVGRLEAALQQSGWAEPQPLGPLEAGDWRRRAVARLLATHLPHAERLAALRASA